MAYNPTLALSAINPSLVGYTGGVGKAMQAIGGSMSSIGQAKLDFDNKKEDERVKNAQLTLLQNADTRAADAVKQTLADKATAKQDKFDENVNFTDLYRQNRGMDVLPELSTERAQAGSLSPDMYLKAQLTEKARKIHSDYNNANGGRTILWDTGETSDTTGTGGDPFIEKAMQNDVQYIMDPKTKKMVPTRVMTNMFGGKQNEVTIPGITDTTFNQNNGASLALYNTLEGQANSARLGLKYAPLVEDAKDKIRLENTLKSLNASGFTEDVTPGQYEYYKNHTPEGASLNIQSYMENGVQKLRTKPNNIFTRPSR